MTLISEEVSLSATPKVIQGSIREQMLNKNRQKTLKNQQKVLHMVPLN
jgi:hypothetical protein